jgi:hypothetical protein
VSLSSSIITYFRPTGAAALGLVCAVTALVLAASADATTSPGGHIYIPVVISNTSLTVISPTPNSGEIGEARGAVATFLIVNRSKTARKFSILGKVSKKIKPGARAALTVILFTRGSFPYEAIPGRSWRFRGKFTVY